MTKKDRKVLQTMGDIGRDEISQDIFINRFQEDMYIVTRTYEKLYNKDGQLRTWVHISHTTLKPNRNQSFLARNTPKDLKTRYV